MIAWPPATILNFYFQGIVIYFSFDLVNGAFSCFNNYFLFGTRFNDYFKTSIWLDFVEITKLADISGLWLNKIKYKKGKD